MNLRVRIGLAECLAASAVLVTTSDASFTVWTGLAALAVESAVLSPMSYI